MVTAWSLVRFTHVIFAVLWVGGQLTFSLVLIPLIQRRLKPELAAGIRSTFGKMFGIFTLGIFLPVQAVTGYFIAAHRGVTNVQGAALLAGAICVAVAVLVIATRVAAPHGQPARR